jgi:deoxyhypusine synthase
MQSPELNKILPLDKELTYEEFLHILANNKDRKAYEFDNESFYWWRQAAEENTSIFRPGITCGSILYEIVSLCNLVGKDNAKLGIEQFYKDNYDN